MKKRTVKCLVVKDLVVGMGNALEKCGELALEMGFLDFARNDRRAFRLSSAVISSLSRDLPDNR